MQQTISATRRSTRALSALIGFTVLFAGLAMLMNLLYMLEGSSGLNPLMLVMWLVVLWLVATLSVAALFYAIDLRRIAGKTAVDHPRVPNSAPGQWAFYGFMLLLLGRASWLLHPNRDFLALTLVTVLIAVTFYAVNEQIVRHTVIARPTVTHRKRGAAPV